MTPEEFKKIAKNIDLRMSVRTIEFIVNHEIIIENNLDWFTNCELKEEDYIDMIFLGLPLPCLCLYEIEANSIDRRCKFKTIVYSPFLNSIYKFYNNQLQCQLGFYKDLESYERRKFLAEEVVLYTLWSGNNEKSLMVIREYLTGGIV